MSSHNEATPKSTVSRLDGKFWTESGAEPWSYRILMRTEYQFFPQQTPATQLSISGWQDAADRDKYFAEFTDEELDEVYTLQHALWQMPRGEARGPTSVRIERIMNKVQRRTGLRDS